ncbi:probable glutathione peroxidase 5 isoform X2 [Zingiber officinale]|uniref:probable glutathione peroxidase 5 isoform X2 n=1 Tax=Zingiber officinale TaxID=94328 RepID=UPI001C4CAE19|nr:probable glutathione peroxidase 5 isoform X2 [Zingiber officinale]
MFHISCDISIVDLFFFFWLIVFFASFVLDSRCIILITERIVSIISSGLLVSRQHDMQFDLIDFLGQEPWDDQKIKEFACTRFKADYPIFQKVKVNGPATAPVYRFLKASKPGFCGKRIKWNFTKFLVDKDGKVIGRYGTSTPPLSIEKDIEKALGSQHE